jgi:uncharacterized membrane protein
VDGQQGNDPPVSPLGKGGTPSSSSPLGKGEDPPVSPIAKGGDPPSSPLAKGGTKGGSGRKPFQRLERHIWRKVFAGFIVLVPLFVTFLVLRFIFSYLDNLFRPLIRDTPLLRDIPLDFPGVGVVFAVILLYVVGMLVSIRAGRRAIDWQHAVLSRVPVVKSIYSVAKQATDAFSGPVGHHFSRVVFIEWPRAGALALGFITGQVQLQDNRVIVAIYIPTAPTPTSGMLVMVPQEEVIETDISVEDAMKMVFSVGIVHPPSITLQPFGSAQGRPWTGAPRPPVGV